MSKRIQVVQPEGWARPRGYVNGMVTTGRLLHVAGQIGWQPESGEFVETSFPGQFGRALDNVLAVVRAAGGQPCDVVRLTIYATDLDGYRAAARDLGQVWRDRFGKHYPAMALVGVAALVEPRALVEIEAVASLPDDEE